MSADEKDEKAPVAEQVAAESAKRAAKKTAQARAPRKAAASGDRVKVIVTTSSRGVKAGARRTLAKADADRLIRQGHARKA